MLKTSISKCALFLLLIICFGACQDPGLIGIGLLEDDKINLVADDDFEIVMNTIRSERLISTSNRGVQSPIAIIGRAELPLLGRVKSYAYLQYQLSPTEPFPDFTGAVLDSMVLVLSYDETGFYGNRDAMHRIIVAPPEKGLREFDTLYTDEIINLGGSPIADITIKVSPTDSVAIINPVDSSLQKLPPQLRVPLDYEFANKIFNDVEALRDNDLFQSRYKGLRLEDIPSDDSFIAFNVSEFADGPSGRNRIAVYYTDSLGSKRLYTFRFTTKKHQYFEHNYSGSIAETLMDTINPTREDIAFLHAMQGTDVKIEFKNLDKLKGKIINYAILEMSIAPISENNLSIFPAPELLTAGVYSGGSLRIATDIFDLGNINNRPDINFGGKLEYTSSADAGTYRMNITKTLKEFVEGKLDENSLVVLPYLRTRTPRWVVLRAHGAESRPVKLKVLYTEN